MRNRRPLKTIAFLSFLIFCLTAVAVGQQSRTLLPDGRVLMLGGVDSHGSPSNDAFIAAPGGTPQQLPASMNVARTGHTATLLPDGTVFVFGGVGANGQLVSVAESFDPVAQTFSVMPDVLAVPRAGHTATLLTNGLVLLAGGVETGHEFADDVQFWDFRAHQALSQHASMFVPREGHTAALLADGSVRIFGGTDRFGRPVTVNEIFDPLTKSFRFASPQEMSDAEPELSLAASIPEDRDSNISIQAFIALRFSRLLNVVTVNSSNLILTGPDNTAVAVKVTGAEEGRLAFVLPTSPLQPGTTYTLQITQAADSTGTQLQNTAITFTTEGVPPATGVGSDDGTGANTTTTYQQLPPLKAGPGETALAGQVLKLNGLPLEHVTLQFEGDNRTVESDHTGRFLMKGLSAGHHVLWIDATTANRDGVEYGLYKVGVTILAGKTNVLNYTIWMAALDTLHAVTIPSPTTKETIITNPLLPGLELHLPANTVITNRYGKIVRRISITPVPIPKPPFPLPAGVQVPIYFTIQPGGASIKVLNSGSGNNYGATGARLFYPNSSNLRPGTPFQFWNYDAAVRGWYIYGQGQVAANGANIVPNPGVVIYEFTGAMVGTGDPGQQACLHSWRNLWGLFCPKSGDPVSLATGEFIYEKTDLVLPDVIPIAFTRTYHNADSLTHAFGVAFTNNYDIYLRGSTQPYTFQELVMPNGARVRFDRINPGVSDTGALYEALSEDSDFYGAQLFEDPTASTLTWEILKKDGTTILFPESFGSTNPFCQAPFQISDRLGNTVQLQRTPTSNNPTGCNLTKITSPNGRSITFTNDSQGRIIQAQDNSGRTVSYTYDAAGRLSTVTDVGGGVTTYTYNDQNQMTSVQDARGIVYLANQYDSSGRVVQQTNADGGTYLYSWTATGNTAQLRTFGGVALTPAEDAGGAKLFQSGCFDGTEYNRGSSLCALGYLPLVAHVQVTDPRGYVRQVNFGPTGNVTTDIHAMFQPEQQTNTYQYYGDNLLQSATDTLGRTTSFNYDGMGNMTSVTRLAGTSNAVTSSAQYAPPFEEVTSMTDPLGNTRVFNYDSAGNLVSITDPLGNHGTATFDAQGRIVSSTDALGNATQFSYNGGDLATVTDPLGNVTTQSTDAVGRITAITDALGNTTDYQYNSLNLVTQATDAQGNSTAFAYDANGNLLTLTDALTHTTSYTYDTMDRVVNRTDPLLRQESYSYDLNGNLASATDRRGEVTVFSYDGINRMGFAGFNASGGSYESTISYTYDAGNRMTQALNSCATGAPGCVNGTIADIYDGLDRLVSEATPQGTITYQYDNAGRRTSMTVPCSSGGAACAPVNYSYDNANRLTQISQSNSIIGFSYDNDNRRTAFTLPNGVNVSYTYDSDSRLTGITYHTASSVLGNLSYAYDQLGRRTQVGGSFARTALPGVVSAATYDAANELTNWNGTALSYDADGNMLSDGTNAFTWNARGQIATLNGRNLGYDANGRRVQSLLGTSFLYDGANAVQEFSSGTVTANILSGGVDEVFTRTDSSGAFMQLKDALGSTIALVDSGGGLGTSYTYDPFGNTSVTGSGNTNEFQYTGRENEGNGLYFYRARYYSPLLGRFISEDPMGFEGSGVNFYKYSADDPTNLSDPSGLDSGLPISLPGADHPPAIAGRKDNHAFGDCLARNAQDFSIAGVVDLSFGTDIHDTFVGNLLGGNHLMGAMTTITGTGNDAGPVGTSYGIDAAEAGASATAHLAYQAAFNSTLKGGGAVILNNADYANWMGVVRSGTAAAEQATSLGNLLSDVGEVLEPVGNVVNLGMSFTTRLLVDAALTGAEEIDCGLGVIH